MLSTNASNDGTLTNLTNGGPRQLKETTMARQQVTAPSRHWLPEPLLSSVVVLDEVTIPWKEMELCGIIFGYHQEGLEDQCDSHDRWYNSHSSYLNSFSSFFLNVFSFLILIF